MCLSPVNLVQWQTEMGASSVADIADRQAGRPAANPTCQPTRGESMPIWDPADKQTTMQLWAERSESPRICWSRPPFACSATSQRNRNNPKILLMWWFHHLPPTNNTVRIYIWLFGHPQTFWISFKNALVPYDKHPCWCIFNYNLEMLNEFLCHNSNYSVQLLFMERWCHCLINMCILKLVMWLH